jgi:hypothetical protein
MQIAVAHLDQAFDHMNQAMTVLSSVIFDLQKGADFVRGYRDSLFRVVEDNGGDVTESVEHAIREFIPRNYRPPTAEETAEDPGA